MGDKIILINSGVAKEAAEKNKKKSIQNQHNKYKQGSFTDYADSRLICRSGTDIILVGLTEGQTRPSAKVVSFPEAGERKAWVYEEKVGMLGFLPKNMENIAFFRGAMKIYDDNGVSAVIRGDKINVMRKVNTLYIRIGDTVKQNKKAAKAKKLADMGVWRA